MSGCRRKREEAGVYFKSPTRADPNLVTPGWVGDKPLLVTIYTGAYASVAWPHIVAGWPERQPKQHNMLQTASGEAFPRFKEDFLTRLLGRRPLKIWEFVANIHIEFNLRLDILCPCHASVDLGRQMLRLAEEEVSLWGPGAGSRRSSLLAANYLISA
jgi:hypothetical protein